MRSAPDQLPLPELEPRAVNVEEFRVGLREGVRLAPEGRWREARFLR